MTASLLLALCLAKGAWALAREQAQPQSASTPPAREQAQPQSVSDTIADKPVDGDTLAPKRTLFKRFLDYFNDANKNKHNRKFDFSIIGGPHYSTDTKFGVGLVAAGLYHASQTDSVAMPSNVSLYSDLSTVGFYLLGVRGTHIFPHDRYRLDYTLYFYSFPSKYWGMGYEAGDCSDNESDLKRWQARIRAAFLFRLARGLYLGPVALYDYVKGKNPERPELLEGQPLRTHNQGFGLTLVYDTRDVMTCPHRGVYLNLSQYFRPKFLGNDFAFSTTDIDASGYLGVWKGGILAGNLRAVMNAGHPSWAMMAMLGGSTTMRGYYEGRYRDKCKIEAQVELRQHVYRRNGVALWVGAGEVFGKFSDMRMRRVLPNYGLGYRWEFKKDVNVRLDYGFGRGDSRGFLFSINEAF